MVYIELVCGSQTIVFLFAGTASVIQSRVPVVHWQSLLGHGSHWQLRLSVGLAKVAVCVCVYDRVHVRGPVALA